MTGNKMTEYQSHLQDVLDAPEGPHIGALFDFDGTIIAGYSATSMLWEKIRRGEMTTGNMGFSGLMTGAAKFMKGVTEESYFEFGEELYEKYIARKVYPEARALIEAHRAKGHTIAIISSATIYQIEPTARDLDIEHVLCSQYEVENGEFTGDIIRPLCFGEGKVIAAENLAADFGLDLDNSYFYSDSYDDIELLERVGKPRPLNPNGKLREAAQKNGWPLEKYDSRGQGKPVDYVRTIYATGSLIGSAIASLPIWALTGSQREAMNFSTGLFGDLATALTGCELEVTGEENLWTSRPCIFVFNHQSKADVMILAKLIRKDMGGVAKKEVRDTPVIGKLMELAGTVFVDRANAGSAIKAMAPLIDAVKIDGKSIVIAPEGTRTLSPKLGPFKKGAFHMAIQAGVPMVPIVIHNAGDVAPKNEFLMRPAKVRVDILPAVDTSKWSTRTMTKHVAEVRGMFLEALGQAEEEEALAALVEEDAEVVKKPVASKRPRKPSAAGKKAAPVKITTPSKPPVRKTGVKKAATKKPVAKKPASRSTRPKKPTAETPKKVQAAE